LEATQLTDTSRSVKLRLFDDYDNQYNQAKFAENIVAKVVDGDGTFLKTTMSTEGDYSIAVTPKYPPKDFSMLIYYKKGKDEINMVKEKIKTTVITTLDWRNTELHGSGISGAKVDEEMKFNVLLKDVKGYCFESEKKVTVKISGPFVSKDLKDNTVNDI
jgi:hypothetical protein